MLRPPLSSPHPIFIFVCTDQHYRQKSETRFRLCEGFFFPFDKVHSFVISLIRFVSSKIDSFWFVSARHVSLKLVSSGFFEIRSQSIDPFERRCGLDVMIYKH